MFGFDICSLLESIFGAFSSSPFFGFFASILSGILSLFGCDPISLG